MADQAIASTPPLSGIRVLDFSHILAGPFCTRLLADLGADVVKVESSTRPDRMGVSKDDSDYKGRRDRPASFLNTNRNKRSLTLNLKTDGGRDMARRLAAVADVLIENFSAGVMARLGLDYEDLRDANPRLIYIGMSGYGHAGPRRDWTSMNANLQAYTGLMMVTGAEGGLPVSISNSWNDYIGGLHACFGILQSLAERAQTGLGAHLDLAQFECSVATLAPMLLAGAVNRTAPPRLGNRSTHAAPQGCYRCAGDDDWCVISVQTDEQWHALKAVLGDPSELLDPELDRLIGRLKRHDEIDAVIEAWSCQLSNLEVEGRLKAAGIPAERMRTAKDVVDCPDTGEVFQPMEDPPGWQMLVTGLPFTFQRSPVAPLSPAPRVGEHTRDVLQEWLGASTEEVERLDTEGALT